MLLFFFFTSHLSLIFQHIFWSVIYVIIHFLKIGINEVKPNTDLEVFSLLEVREKPNWLLLSSKIAFINVIVSTLLLSSLYLYVLFFFFFHFQALTQPQRLALASLCLQSTGQYSKRDAPTITISNDEIFHKKFDYRELDTNVFEIFSRTSINKIHSVYISVITFFSILNL